MSGALQRACPVLALFACQLFAATAVAEARIALVADGAEHVVAFDTAANQVVGSPTEVGLGPFGIAITPNARTAYVTNIDLGQVQAIDVGSRQVVGAPMDVTGGPEGFAITPDGSRAYVANNGGGAAAVIDTATNLVGTPIPVGTDPNGIAITPNGRTAYVTNYGSDDVSVVDLAGARTIGTIPVGAHPRGVAITPDGARAYVASETPGSVSVIDTATNQIVGTPIVVGAHPRGVAITPDGTRAYVANGGLGSISVIDTATNQIVGTPIVVGDEPRGVTISPDGTRAYVAVQAEHYVAVIDTATNQVGGPPIVVGAAPQAIAVTPDQAPIAAFISSTARPEAPASFDATTSRDPDGSVGRFDWNFGDGSAAANGGPSPQHTYARPGRYRVTLTLTDNEGCSTSIRFTGQTAYCNGSALASRTEFVSVSYPAVRVRCPRRAKPKGCRFQLTAVTKRRKGKAMTPTARASAKAGVTKVVSLRPKPRFAARLAGAGKILIRERVTIDGSSKKRFVRLPVVRPAG